MGGEIEKQVGLCLKPEIDAGAHKSRSHIHGVREDVRRECNRRRECRQVAGGNGCCSEISP